MTTLSLSTLETALLAVRYRIEHARVAQSAFRDCGLPNSLDYWTDQLGDAETAYDELSDALRRNPR
jgi:hypothetical protein